MESLKEIRTRIATVRSTRQITSAMKMVAASKLRRAQDRIIQLRPYTNKLYDILSYLSNNNLQEEEKNIFMQEREQGKVLIVVITSNRGLCGPFNANVIRQSLELAQITYTDHLQRGDLHFITIGKKGTEILKSKKYPVVASYNELFDDLSFVKVAPLAEQTINDFIDAKYDKIEIVYNQFKNAAVQILTVEQFLPIKINIKHNNETKNLYYILEPDKDYILEKTIPRALKIQFYKAILDSYVSEQGARMTAMHQATDNATELLRELTLYYNKARQAAITKEILEIVGGSEALIKA
jgi:F-type H+-transporting ATPase subunit gamma